MDRYEAHGIPYEMEEDKVVIAGPSWLEFGLKYEPVMNGDQTGKVHNRYRDFRGFPRPRTSEPVHVRTWIRGPEPGPQPWKAKKLSAVEKFLSLQHLAMNFSKEKILVQARSLKTPADFPQIPGVPDPACYHYCHLLSPARIMEWIYTDSLRENLGYWINISFICTVKFFQWLYKPLKEAILDRF